MTPIPGTYKPSVSSLFRGASRDQTRQSQPGVMRKPGEVFNEDEQLAILQQQNPGVPRSVLLEMARGQINTAQTLRENAMAIPQLELAAKRQQLENVVNPQPPPGVLNMIQRMDAQKQSKAAPAPDLAALEKVLGRSIVAREKGGPVNAGQMALVGERGPELIIPNDDVTVIPNGVVNTGQPMSTGVQKVAYGPSGEIVGFSGGMPELAGSEAPKVSDWMGKEILRVTGQDQGMGHSLGGQMAVPQMVLDSIAKQDAAAAPPASVMAAGMPGATTAPPEVQRMIERFIPRTHERVQAQDIARAQERTGSRSVNDPGRMAEMAARGNPRAKKKLDNWEQSERLRLESEREQRLLEDQVDARLWREQQTKLAAETVARGERQRVEDREYNAARDERNFQQTQQLNQENRDFQMEQYQQEREDKRRAEEEARTRQPNINVQPIPGTNYVVPVVNGQSQGTLPMKQNKTSNAFQIKDATEALKMMDTANKILADPMGNDQAKAMAQRMLSKAGTFLGIDADGDGVPDVQQQSPSGTVGPPPASNQAWKTRYGK